MVRAVHERRRGGDEGRRGECGGDAVARDVMIRRLEIQTLNSHAFAHGSIASEKCSLLRRILYPSCSLQRLACHLTHYVPKSYHFAHAVSSTILRSFPHPFQTFPLPHILLQTRTSPIHHLNIPNSHPPYHHRRCCPPTITNSRAAHLPHF